MRWLLALAMAMLIVAGCGGGSAAPRPIAVYPVKLGNSWTYQLSGTDLSGTSTEKITKVGIANGLAEVTFTQNTSITISGQTLLPTTQTSAYQFEPDGYVVVAADAGPTTTTGTAGASGGQSFPSFGDLVAGKSVSGSYSDTTWKSTGMGAQDVTVPAGTYKGCAVMDSVVTQGTGASAITYTSTYWFARGVGLVKSVQSVTDQGTITLVMQSTTVKP